jgi:hypothetical protein
VTVERLLGAIGIIGGFAALAFAIMHGTGAI